MQSVVIRSVVAGLVLAVLLTAALFITAGYAILRLGAEGLREVQNVSRSRGVEIALAVAQMAGEKFDDDMGVKLSSVMNQVVRISQQRNEDFQVREMIMLRSDGTIMAANEITRVARDAEKKYDGPEYARAMELLARTPTSIRATKEERTGAVPVYDLIRKFSPGLADALARSYPEKVAVEYHVIAAVYPVDEDIQPAGAVHMFVTVQSVNQYLAALKRYSINTILVAILFVFFISFAMIALLLLAFRGAAGAAPASAASGEDDVLEEFPQSHAEPIVSSRLSDDHGAEIHVRPSEPPLPEIHAAPAPRASSHAPAHAASHAPAHASADLAREAAELERRRIELERRERELELERRERDLERRERELAREPAGGRSRGRIMDAIPLENIPDRTRSRPSEWN
jgi:hypothetical protein